MHPVKSNATDTVEQRWRKISLIRVDRGDLFKEIMELRG